MRFVQVVSLLLCRNLECAARSEDRSIQGKLESNAMALEVLKQRMKKQNEELLDSLDKVSLLITGSVTTDNIF